ncbi:MAG TPA: multidrug efflux SMR transporter [Coleofasciculaceae cyanobacterium]
MGWLFLGAAIVLEVAGTISAKQANGFTNFTASVLMMLCYGLAFSGLTFAMRSIEMSIAYPVWTGVAILAVSILGIILFHESMGLVKGFSIFLLVIGLVGLTMGGQSHS